MIPEDNKALVIIDLNDAVEIDGADGSTSVEDRLVVIVGHEFAGHGRVFAKTGSGRNSDGAAVDAENARRGRLDGDDAFIREGHTGRVKSK